VFRIFKEIFWKIKTGVITHLSKLRNNKNGKNSNISEPSNHNALDKILVASVSENKTPNIRQFKHLSLVLTKKEKSIIQSLLLVIIIALGFLGFRFYTSHFAVVPIVGGEYTEGLIGAPRYVNPLLASTNDVDLDLVKLIFSGLLKYDENLKLTTDLAQDYAVSDDQKTFTFTLKKALWHDGVPFTSDDVAFTYVSIQDPNFKSPLRFALRGVKIEKNGNNQIIFRLSESYPAFLQILTTGILPEHIWGKIPPINSNLTEFNLKPIGLGPWKFKSLAKDGNGNIKSYTLIAHTDHYGAVPYLKKLTFKFFPDFDSAIEALNNRGVEGLSYVSKDRKKNIKNPNIQFYSYYLPQYTAIFFNQKNNDLLKEKNIRKALSLGVDKTKIFTDAIKLQGEVIYGPILPGSIGYTEEQKEEIYNPMEAKNILDELGWKEISLEEYDTFKASLSDAQNATSTVSQSAVPLEDEKKEQKKDDGPAIYRKKGKEILSIALTTVDIPEYTETAGIVKAQWENIGIRVTTNIISPEKIFREIIKPRNYEILLYGENYGADPDPFPFWHSSQIQDPGLNLAIFSNRNADKLLEDARSAKNAQEKIESYKNFSQIVQSEYSAIFLYSPTYTYAMKNIIHIPSIERIIFPHDRLINSEYWYINTGRRWKKS